MKILPISAFRDNYIWLIINEKNKTACCVDPGDAQPVIDFICKSSIQLVAILVTHHHHDHIGGITELVKAYPEMAVYGPDDPQIPTTQTLADGDNLSLLSCQFLIIGTPGHTKTHISFYEPHHEWLFCGDTLFSAGCGRVFDGTIEELHQSLSKLKALPDSTQVFCAHEYTQANLRFATTVEPDNQAIKQHSLQLQKNKNASSLPSTIALEKEINPFFRTENKDVQHYALRQGSEGKSSLSVFRQLRIDKDNFY
ncbi:MULTISPECIES: hydroxyacylglutathione hydrolase [unclassified Legionella]|uniref:hydroxyacylglutathione hydrolase n=1 Tax=unclassified Legionella TaxID=2622702 RepID=UPI0010568EA6|nr:MULTISPECIES: hydroxyacylglutathione hydrolase [unclassified Legionella]MDI9818272.1 hydroxyacylglutathione hydrolase [Legionella sp. PL877]